MLSDSKLIDISEYSPNVSKFASFFNNIEYFNDCYNEFFKKYLSANQPCIIRNVSTNWKCTQLWVKENKPSFDYLESHYGNAIVPIANCNEKYFNCQIKTSMKFTDFTNYWNNLIQNGYPTSEPCLYLKDWHFTKDFPDENVYTVPPEFSNDWLNEYFTKYNDMNDDYRFVYMGPKGSWTPFHVDVFTSYSWSVNLCGEKKWILLPPGEENKLRLKCGNLPYDISHLNINNNGSLENTDIVYFTVIQKAGEAVFVPSGWCHQVWNTQDTISINHNWINSNNITKIWLSMKISLADVKKEILEFKNSMDGWEEHCQLLLKSCFGMDFKEFYKFISYIIEVRKGCLETGNKLKVYGGWILGENYLKFDLKRAQEILDIFLNDCDTKLLFSMCNHV